MRRGEVWTAAGGADYAGKPRPVVIVQDDQFASTRSVAICSLTTNLVDADVLRVPVRPAVTNGLRIDSHLMVDKITTIPRSKMGRWIGQLTEEDMARLSDAMVVFLGLSR